MTINGYTISQPSSGCDVQVTAPDGKRSHLLPSYDTEYEYDHAATMARAVRFIVIREHRRSVGR